MQRKAKNDWAWKSVPIKSVFWLDFPPIDVLGKEDVLDWTVVIRPSLVFAPSKKLRFINVNLGDI